MPGAEIISQGDEVLTGQTLDTNAAWLAERLTALGFTVLRHTTVGDRRDDIREAVLAASQRAELCLCTGGLGPTEDDLTAEAVADAAGRTLIFDAEAMGQIEGMFARFGKPMPESNRKQAWFPQGALRLDNRWGTAPGFGLQVGPAWLLCLPGVPTEMRPMFEGVVVPVLHRRFSLRPGRLVTLRTAGIGESRLQQRIGPWRRREVTLGYRTMPPENQVKLRFPPDTADQEARAVAESLAARIGEAVFSIEGLGDPTGDLPSVTLGLLGARAQTVAVAEWGCGGRLCALLYDGVGAEDVLRGGRILGRGERATNLPSDAAPVSEAAARALAEDALVASGATYGLALTVVADPDLHGSQRGSGSAHVALAGCGGTQHRPFQVAGSRSLIRTLAAGAAVDFLRRQLLRG